MPFAICGLSTTWIAMSNGRSWPHCVPRASTMFVSGVNIMLGKSITLTSISTSRQKSCVSLSMRLRKQRFSCSSCIQMTCLCAGLMKHPIAVERSGRMLPQSLHAFADLRDECVPVFKHGIAWMVGNRLIALRGATRCIVNDFRGKIDPSVVNRRLVTIEKPIHYVPQCIRSGCVHF